MAGSGKQQNHREGYRPFWYIFPVLLTLLTMLFCLSTGSVAVPFRDTVRILWRALLNLPQEKSMYVSILLSVRLPRVLCVLLSGAALSLSGAAMQGLLKNPLADGSTLGVSSGASLGAVIAIVFGISFPALPFAGTVIMAVLFAFGTLLLVLLLAYRLDCTLSTNTIILIGVVFSMLVSSLISLFITFAPDKLKSITFWTMGSLSGAGMADALLLTAVLVPCAAVLFSLARELNAFAIGEDNARNIGIHVKRVRFTVLVTVSVLVGTCVSVGGTIGFVGLVTPHMVRFITGPNHKKLLPASAFAGAVFLMLCDLAARTVFSPRELPIGTVTSLIGALLFIFIFYKTRTSRA